MARTKNGKANGEEPALSPLAPEGGGGGVVRKRSAKRSGDILPPFLGMTFSLLALLSFLYLLATILTPWTGVWGRNCAAFLLSSLGGGSVFLLFFGIYLAGASLVERPVPKPFRQFGGTAVLYAAVAMLLGLQRLLGFRISLRQFAPGIVGETLAEFLVTNLGPAGTVLVGLGLLLSSLILYGCFDPEKLGGILLRLKAVFSLVTLRKKSELPVPEVALPYPEEFSLSPEGDKVPEQGVSALSEEVGTSSPAFLSRENGSGGEVPCLVLSGGFAAGDSEEPAGEENGSVLRRPCNASRTVSAPLQRIEEERNDSGSEVERAERHRPPTAEEGKPCETGRHEFVPEETPLATDPLEQLLAIEEEHSCTDGEDDFVLPGEKDGRTFPPPLEVLGPREEPLREITEEQVASQGERIIRTLGEFGVEAALAETVVGPTVIQFRLQLAPGIKVSRVAGLANDLAVGLAVPSLRVEAPIPGKPYVGVEIPNPERVTVLLRSLLEEELFRNTRADLPLPVGVSVDGRPMVMSLEDMPHLLVAGTTGSGKSVFVSSCLIGLTFLRRPEELRLILVDPKRVEMTLYERIPHILTPPVVDSKKAVHALAWAIREMERRYEVFARARVRHLKAYNAKTLPKDRLPHVVIVVDELADLMMTAPKDVEDYICRLAQKARATGIHLILATQRPSVNVITGLIKANIPARVAFTLPTQADSRTILDVSGAERLLGKGDMLLLTSRFPKPLRCQATWIEEKYIAQYVEYLVALFGEPAYVDITAQEDSGFGEGTLSADDPLLEEAVRIVLETGIASASRLQRQLRVGFTRASRLVDTMEQMGIVGPPDGARPREILVDEDRAEDILASLSPKGERNGALYGEGI